MIIIGICVILFLCLCNGGVDTAAEAQRVSDANAGAAEQIVPATLARADGCLSGCVWLFLGALLVALVGAAMMGGVGG